MVKLCSHCKQEKPATAEFYGPDKRRPCGFQSQCRECMQAAKKVSYIKHKDHVLAQTAQYRNNHRNEIKNYFQQYNLERRDYLRTHYEDNRDHYHQTNKEWRLANPERRKATFKKRRVIEKQQTPKWLTIGDQIEIKWAYQAAKELSKERGIEIVPDHIIPFQGKNVCGLNVPWNIQFLTRRENEAKKNKFDGTYNNNGWRQTWSTLMR